MLFPSKAIALLLAVLLYTAAAGAAVIKRSNTTVASWSGMASKDSTPEQEGGSAATILHVYNAMAEPLSAYVLGTDNTVLAPGDTQILQLPPGFSGMGAYVAANGAFDGNTVLGTKWEVNVGPTKIDYDVSYVDGYSVPMTCSCSLSAWSSPPGSGCNIDLFRIGNACPDPVSGGTVCRNPSRGGAPPQPFFQPCVGAAYTSPHDDRAETNCPAGNQIWCCVGPRCQPSVRQHS